MRRFAPALAALAFAAAVRAEDPPALPAKPITGFTLPDVSDRPVSLKDFAGKKAVVVVFIGTECPVNNGTMPRLVELHREFADRGVQFVAINSNCQDTPGRIAGHAKEYGLPFPVLRDAGNVVADAFDARRTPEAFVLDPAGKVLYRGRVDDQVGIGFKRPAPTRRDLAEALEEVLAGKPVSVPATVAPGCIISRAMKPKETGTVTFTKDVSRVLQARCQECHRPGQVAPMPLLTYEDALSWSDMIREVVREGRMPPWHADPAHGTWSNDRRLTKEERDALLAWIDQGCPKGDPKDLPEPRQFAEGWTIGKPDAVFTMPTEFKVPARAERGVAYKYFLVPTNYEEDRWIQAVEAKPGNRAVVHHILVYVRPKSGGRRDALDGIGNGFLVAYAPGDMPSVFPAGTAKKLPKGADLVFQMHYTPNGVEQTDRSSVGLVFAAQPPKLEVRTRAIAQQLFAIPPGAKHHEVRSASVFRDEVELYSLMPHMHLRGADFLYKAIYPDGKEEVLLSVPKYDFNWQSVYRFPKPLRLPAGTRIECTAHFDNSTDNFNNPDPKALVRWGDQTWEEMMIGFVDYAPLPK